MANLHQPECASSARTGDSEAELQMNRTHVVVFGDDGAEHTDRTWLSIGNHRWPGWRLDAIAAHLAPVGPPVGEERSTPHPGEPPSPRQIFAEAAFAEVRFPETEADPRIVLNQSEVGLVVIRAQGTGTLKALHLDSTAEYVLHHPVAPLAIVRSSTTVCRVLVGVDGSTNAQLAVEALAAMPCVDQLQAVEVLGTATVDSHDDTDEIRSAIRRAVDVLDAASVKADRVEAAGHQTGTIVDHAQVLRVDLIVSRRAGRPHAAAVGLHRQCCCPHWYLHVVAGRLSVGRAGQGATRGLVTNAIAGRLRALKAVGADRAVVCRDGQLLMRRA